MTQENDNGIVRTLTTMGMLMFLFGILGMAFMIVWSIIKTPIWLMSPHKGGITLSEERVMQIPLSMTLMSPYFHYILWPSGVCACFVWVYVANAAIPTSSVNTKPEFFWFIMSIIIASGLITAIGMLNELVMILKFEKWIYRNKL